MREKDLYGSERKCPICNKVFIKHDGWVYERTLRHSIKTFCSWTCLRKWEASKGNKVDRRDKIIQGIYGGLSDSEISKLLEEDISKVKYWRKKIEKESIEERTKRED